MIDFQCRVRVLTGSAGGIGRAIARLGTPHEVAGVVAFLCSDLAGFVVGKTVQVNGGPSMA